MKYLLAPNVVFDGQHVQMLHYECESDYTLLTFDIMHAKANGKNAFGRKLAFKAGINLLAVVPKYPCWYPQSEMLAMAPVAQRLVRHRCIAYGSSMGAYGALRWGKEFGATTVLACSPQATIDPDITGRVDQRYAKYYSADLHADMRVQANHVPTENAVLYDPYFKPDQYQAELLINVPQVNLLAVPHVGHGTAACVKGTESSQKIFRFVARQQMQELKSYLLKKRKEVPAYHINLSLSCLRRMRPELAERIAAYAENKDAVGYHMTIAKIAQSLGDYSRAMTCYSRVLDIKPQHNTAKLRLETIKSFIQ